MGTYTRENPQERKPKSQIQDNPHIYKIEQGFNEPLGVVVLIQHAGFVLGLNSWLFARSRLLLSTRGMAQGLSGWN
jgi:hypothetical protein